ncbi:MAG: VWA domain-containing protein [Terracidiphilus sp.]
MRLRFLWLLPSVAVCCLAAGPHVQTTAPADQGPVPVFKAHSHAVVVDVVVTKGDDAVTGLHKQDFQVLEDGKPVTVDFFEEHTAKTLPPGAAPALEKMPPNVYTNVPPAPESDSVNVLLLDTLNTDRQDQAYVHQQMVNFLKTMQPGLRVAVFVLGSKLRMVQGFTTDSGVLRDAINDKKNGLRMEADTSVTRSLQDKFDDLEDKGRLADMQMGAAGFEALSDLQQGFAGYQADQRFAMTLEAFDSLSRYLAGVPGRKNLIWFSSSFPVTILLSPKDKQNIGQVRQISAALRETEDLLTVSKVAVYPIGAEGMMVNHGSDGVIQSNGAVDVEGGEVNSRSGAVVSHRPSDFMTPFANENAARSDKIMAMEQLAADTGGKAFYNTNDLNASMMHAIEHGAHYYTLVYTPTNKKMDGSYRRIEVKTTAGKYNLAYRRGYNADDTQTADTKSSADPLHALLIRGMPSATQVLYGVRVVPVTPQPAPDAKREGKNAKLSGPTTRYSIDFLVRWSDVALETAADGTHRGKIQASLLAYDREGNAVNWTGVTQGMALTPENFAAIQKSGVPMHLEIDLPSSAAYLETGVYDWSSGKAGTLEVPVSGNAQTAQAAPATK